MLKCERFKRTKALDNFELFAKCANKIFCSDELESNLKYLFNRAPHHFLLPLVGLNAGP